MEMAGKSKRATKPTIVFTDPTNNLVEKLRLDNNENLSRPTNPFIVLDGALAGMSVDAKLSAVEKALEDKRGGGRISLVLSNLDEINYLLNLRTDPGDIGYSRWGICYCKVDLDGGGLGVTLYVDEEKIVGEGVKGHLEENKVVVKGYEKLMLKKSCSSIYKINK